MSRQNPPPRMKDVLDAVVRNTLISTNCVSVGTVQSFDGSTQTATVSINYKRVFKDAIKDADGSYSDRIVDYPLLTKVPVLFLSGGVSSLTFPVVKGDTCILLFNDRELCTWLFYGNTDKAPVDGRFHDLGDAMAIVGIKSLANPLQNFNTVIASLIDKTGERLAQAGDVKATARTTAPSGWLLCYGQAVSRETYDILFTAIGTTYGVGDSSTTFNLPDLRGRTIVGLDNMGGSAANRLTITYTPNRDTLGGGVGEEAHQLTIPELPAHTHDETGRQTQPGGGGAYPTHWAMDAVGGPGTSLNLPTGVTGEDVAHNTVQPGLMLNWIIKI